MEKFFEMEAWEGATDFFPVIPVPDTGIHTLVGNCMDAGSSPA
ncbi:MAG: hypothetical protein OQK67_01090 [Chlorobium sp.]|nr:hypothetical protein [Chlorobium sp.]MCW8815527.1 hypothetical protein [Chlorobium sp.]MCW8820087.1 hypothetical protein [Ignavibacteriaceae bacterium]